MVKSDTDLVAFRAGVIMELTSKILLKISGLTAYGRNVHASAVN